MCNNCHQESEKYRYKDDCFQVEQTRCDEGCPETHSTDCIFHNIDGEDQSAALPHLGIYAGTSLTYILKQINKKFGEYVTADFSGFNMNGIDEGLTIDTLKSFVEAVTASLKVLKTNDNTLGNKISTLTTSLESLLTLVDTYNKPELSSAKLNVNSGDTVKAVLSKLITYIESISSSVQEANYSFQDSESIEFSTSGNAVTAIVKVSEKSGNRAFLEEDGIYVTDSSVTALLNAISTDSSLKETFTGIVKSTFPCFYYDLLSAKNQVISYINCVGDVVSVTAKANQVLQLKDVRRILTVAGAELTITFKGI